MHIKKFFERLCFSGLIFFTSYCIGLCIFFNINFGNFMPMLISLSFYLLFKYYDEFKAKTLFGFKKYLRYSLIGLIILGFSTFIIMCINIGIAAQTQPPQNADALIILGGGIKNGKLSPSLANRVNKGLEYLNENENTICIVSGGFGLGESVSEGYAMKNYMTDKGFDANRIIVEDKSTSTKENFIFSKEILDKMFQKPYSVVFVTNDFHVYRSGFTAKNVGLNAYGLPCKSSFFMFPAFYSREYLATILYLVRDGIN